MKIRIKREVRFIKVDVNYSGCRKLSCLKIGVSSRTENEASCLTRDNFGYPEEVSEWG